MSMQPALPKQVPFALGYEALSYKIWESWHKIQHDSQFAFLFYELADVLLHHVAVKLGFVYMSWD